jgi:tetratricopeptide (TPR) repeat protein
MKSKNVNLFLIISFLTLSLGILPSFAKMNGTVSKNHFYDTETTLINDVLPKKILKTEEYWDKNIFYVNKYRPLFMLSNKELYDLIPKQRTSIVQRITTPSVYNISLKTASIKKISLSTGLISQKQEQKQKPQNITHKTSKIDDSLILKYEQAKNINTASTQKIETAIILKESKNIANYLLAIDLLNAVTQAEPYNAYAFYIKGEIYFAQEDFKNAMKNYIAALKINPYSKQSYFSIAKILEKTDKELAKKYYDKAKISEAKI